MQITSQDEGWRRILLEKKQRHWNEDNPDFADDEEWNSRNAWGRQCLPITRQVLATPRVGASQQKKIVHLPLRSPRRINVIFVELPIPQAFEDFPLAPDMLKNSLLLVSQILQAGKLGHNLFALRGESSFRKHAEMEFRRGHSALQMPNLAGAKIPQPCIHLFQ